MTFRFSNRCRRSGRMRDHLKSESDVYGDKNICATQPSGREVMVKDMNEGTDCTTSEVGPVTWFPAHREIKVSQ